MSECKHGVPDWLEDCKECEAEKEAEEFQAELEAEEKDSKLTEDTN